MLSYWLLHILFVSNVKRRISVKNTFAYFLHQPFCAAAEGGMDYICKILAHPIALFISTPYNFLYYQ